jgi:hypothetical protein
MNETLSTYRSTTDLFDSSRPTKKLALIEDLLSEFHLFDIRYCHWKSNEHLDASMLADTDLDILFDKKEKNKVEVILGQLNFKKFKSIPEKQYRDIEDFIGLDIQSGKVVHVHAHFRLTLGEIYLKSYQLNFEDQILDTRIYDESSGIFCIHPAFELILLYFREALKLRNRDALKLFFNKKVQHSASIRVEYNWLQKRVTDAESKAILESLFADPSVVLDLVTGKFSRKELLTLSAFLKKEFRSQRMYDPVKAVFKRWYREISLKTRRKLQKMFNQPVLSRRVNPRGGFIVAVIGADGSGKSSVIADLHATFKTKLDVYKIYFGRGDGKASLFRKLLLNSKNKIRGNGKRIKILKPASGDVNKKGLLFNIYKCAEALSVAWEKKANLKRMQKAKDRGMLVICDRFPQNQIEGYNDGPLLGYFVKSRNFILRTISNLEKRIYASANLHQPDLLFKLIADVDIVEARKPNETPRELLIAKIEGIKKLQLGNTERVVTIDASLPFDMVIRKIKTDIWKAFP